MTAVDPQPPVHGLIGQVARTSDKLITVMPPAFLLMVILNLAFIALVMWFLNSQLEQRAAIVDKLVDRCMAIALQATPPK